MCVTGVKPSLRAPVRSYITGTIHLMSAKACASKLPCLSLLFYFISAGIEMGILHLYRMYYYISMD